MKYHVLNCGTIRLHFPPLEVATRCLLVEIGDSLLLVDTGIGMRDFLDPPKVVRFARRVTRTFGELEQTALNQVIKLGYSTEDVQHIVMTHLHLDHTGGLEDFPQAAVHVYQPELEQAVRKSRLNRLVYLPEHWSHGPNWVSHRLEDPFEWFGFTAIPVLERSGLQVLFVQLAGHTRGHCGVAIGDGARWVFHCGDAFALDAIETKPESILAVPLGPHFSKLHALSVDQAKSVRIIHSHPFLQRTFA